MNSDIQVRMLNAVFACLLPVARLLLRAGITYRQFDSVAKRAFVSEALAESDSRGRRTNTSRVAVKTGLSRKDVRRIRDSMSDVASSELGNATDQSGPPARVLHAWHADPRFLDNQGHPLSLQFQDDEGGFSALVHAVAGDVPPGAVRAELRRAGAVVELDDGRLQAVKRYYVPGDFDEKAITVISGLLFPMAAGIAHNANPARTAGGFIQRFAFSDSLDPQSRFEFRQWSRIQATRFIESMDDWLAEHEVEEGVPESAENRTTSGIGVFYYEGPVAEQVIKASIPSPTK
jgi:hypothetical protein